MARKLAVRLYWMLRLQVNYARLIQGSHAGQPGHIPWSWLRPAYWMGILLPQSTGEFTIRATNLGRREKISG
jgi:hypothetical protein